MIVTEDDIKFTSAHEALVFAFNVTDQAYDRPMMNRMIAPSLGKGGLAGLESAAQAGMIRAEVKKLGDLAEAILMARLSPRSSPCACRSSCCSGHKPNKEWVNAVSYLADYVRTSALAGCTANGMMRREYVVRYFTRKDDRISIEQLADKYEIERHTVTAHSAKVAMLFGGVPAKRDKPAELGLESVAMNAAEDQLREIGMVGS